MINCSQKSRGFVALFFVISIGISLAGFVFLLSQSYSFSFMLLDAHRQKDDARLSALHCMRELRVRLSYDQFYKPNLGTHIPFERGGSCRYVSYGAEGFLPNQATVVVEGLSRGGKSSYEIETIFSFADDLEKPVIESLSRQI